MNINNPAKAVYFIKSKSIVTFSYLLTKLYMSLYISSCNIKQSPLLITVYDNLGSKPL